MTRRGRDVPVLTAACVSGAAAIWASAWVLRRQQQLMDELREAQEALAEAAAAEERARIAREVHDVIAHSLTVTLLHVSAARLAVQDRPGDAAEALAESERLGRRSLADVRRAVGLLGPANGGGAAPSLPAAADLPALVAEYRTAGMDVAWTVTGDLDAVPPGTGLALFRITEESLANIARHAPGAPAEVELAVSSLGAFLRVVNGPARRGSTGTGPGAGLGLSGMRQRAELIGGRLSVGPSGGGWRVELDVPLEADES